MKPHNSGMDQGLMNNFYVILYYVKWGLFVDIKMIDKLSKLTELWTKNPRHPFISLYDNEDNENIL
jgi:hypothetical protein